MLIKRTVTFFTSLRLTVVLLAFSIVLVFVGTLAQVDDGLYAVQAHYFKSIFAGLSLDPLQFTGITLFGYKVPIILPGGYLIGVLLLVNLVSAHIYRFRFTTQKIGIQLAHAGVILLLVGQLATDMFAREMQMNFREGETRNYTESMTDYELVFHSGDTDTAIPAKMLTPGQEFKIDSLPFAIRVKQFWKNSDVNFRAPMMKNGPPLAGNGVAQNFDFRQLPGVKTTDEKNIPTAVIELIGPKGSLGDWAVSDWSGDPSLVEAVQQSYASQVGATMAHTIASELVAPQAVQLDGRTYTFIMRPLRYRQPFSLTLLKATHTVYPGTDIPKDFRSEVLLQNSQTGEKRDVQIYMNHPLRYDGLTFYQYQMDAGQLTREAGRVPSSVLSVVHNPSWLTPYVGCAMVAAGLLIQFLKHLAGFVSKNKKA
jgi:ResB-like family